MNQARATVVRIEGATAWVRVEDRPGGCGRCDEPGGCRSAKLTHALGAPRDTFPIRNTCAARAGERVLLSVVDGAPLKMALIAYLLPVFMALCGAGLGGWLGPLGGDAGQLVGAVVGLFAGYMVARRVSVSWGALAPTVSRLEAESPGDCHQGSR